MNAARFPNGTETRGALSLELRADPTQRKLIGYAAVFNSPTTIGGRFSERVAPGAFRASIAPGGDVLALADHDPAKLLGRTRSGTLQLSEDAHGLAFSLDLPDTALGNDLHTLARRGDLGGMSFGFLVPPGGDDWSGTDRTLRNVQLHEVSVVSSHPAYASTSVAARSRDEAAQCLAGVRRVRFLDTI